MGVSSMPRNVQLQFLPAKEGNATNRNYDSLHIAKESGYDNVKHYLEKYVASQLEYMAIV